MIKYCKKCQGTNEFGSVKWCCKKCHAFYTREYRRTNKGYKESNRNRARVKRLEAIKSYGGFCLCCKEQEAAFFKIASLIDGGKVVLCANCYRSLACYGDCPHGLKIRIRGPGRPSVYSETGGILAQNTQMQIGL